MFSKKPNKQILSFIWKNEFENIDGGINKYIHCIHCMVGKFKNFFEKEQEGKGKKIAFKDIKSGLPWWRSG